MWSRRRPVRNALLCASILLSSFVCDPARGAEDPSLLRQSQADADAKSAGCLACHRGIEPMHESERVHLGCTDCHGGNADTAVAASEVGSPEYEQTLAEAHVAPRFPEKWSDPSAPGRIRVPERSYTLLNQESPEFIRFLNPGDLRVAGVSCGSPSCHAQEVLRVRKSMMTTSALLWGGAAYNNGIVSVKNYIFGESYSPDGVPEKLNTVPAPTEKELARGVLPSLVPLPRWNVAQPADPFRAFEAGGRIDRSNVAEVGNPGLGPLLEEPGKPDMKLGTRGYGTDLRVSAGVLNLQKTRLNDPYLSFWGTNDHPGDYRSSGCSACHVVYANDRAESHSDWYAEYGHDGTYHGKDPTIPRDQPGHPIEHRLTRSIPSSQCIVCHMHQPNSFVNTYLGYQMWDYETDGDLLWPAEQRYPTAGEPVPYNNREDEPIHDSLEANPEEAAVRGLWTDAKFLARVAELPTKETRFADYHGHGWIFRAVYWQDRKGNLLDAKGGVIDWNDPQKLDKAVHLKDIHLEKGMHCVDCHFAQDVHGDGNLYGEYGNALEIGCKDCHGTIYERSTLRTTGPAAPQGGRDLSTGVTPFGKRRFEWVGDSLIQRSMLRADLEWEVSQVLDSIDPASPHYNEKARLAKTIQRDGRTWGAPPDEKKSLAHGDDQMACYTCHTAWVTSCFGCHLPQQANAKKDMQHFEGGVTRNWTSYNPQVIRHDIFMLAKHGPAKGGLITPARSSSALVLSSTNANRERVYMQQPPVSAEGMSSQAFNPHFAHTVRKTQTRECVDCHVSAAGDNNAWLAQVLTLGTNFVNFIGRFVWVGEGEDGLEGVGVTEWDEPQAVIGSNLHRLAYPANFRRHQEHELELQEAHHHEATNALSLQLRGEYLYTANGEDGLRVYDVANIDNKGFSERIVSAPVSPLGQRAYVKTSFAAGVALPTTMPIDWGRRRNPANQEQALAELYRYAYVADRDEGLVVVDVDSLMDNDPQNNFLERAATFNPDGVLDGASYIAIAGNYAYILCGCASPTPAEADAAAPDCRGRLVVVSIENPRSPQVVSTLGAPDLVAPVAISIQFRYAFVADAGALRVLDVTDPARPALVASLALPEARDVYVARTFAYVAAGRSGLAIVDVEKPEAPVLYQMYDAGGVLNDTRAVRVGATDASVYAYVADGANGLRVLQLITPGETPGSAGFSPNPTPRLIATYRTHGPALTLSKGLDRDRAVDESGNQVSVFGRLGSRPFTRAEMERFFLKDGKLYAVKSTPPGKALAWTAPPRAQADEALMSLEPQVQPMAPVEERLLPGRR